MGAGEGCAPTGTVMASERAAQAASRPTTVTSMADSRRPDPTTQSGSSEEAAPTSRSRREHARFKVDATITVASEHNLYSGFVENLSASGVFIATHELRPIGDKVEFTIRLGEAEEVVVTGVGEVRWVREYSETSDAPPGMGVRFLGLGDDSRKRLDDFIRSRDPLFFDDE